MSDFAERYDRLETRLGAWRPPTLLLGLFVTLIGWGVTFALPSPGIDVSWWSGLYMAAHDDLQFGTEIVFTYGPLGFLKLPLIWYDGLASLAFVYGAGMAFALSCALIWTLRSRTGAPLACAVAFLIPAVLPVDYALGLAVLWGFAVISERPPRHAFNALFTAGAVFAAAECLMNLSAGALGLVVLLLALIGARAKLWQIGVFLGTFAGSFLLLWLIAGEAIGNLPDFASNTMQIIVGYNEAMARYGESFWLVVLMIAGVIGVLAWNWFGGKYPDRRTRWISTVIVAVVGAAMYKQGAVRMDSMHVAICFTGLVFVLAAIPAAPRWNYVMLTGVALLAAGSIHVYAPREAMGLDVAGNLDKAVTNLRILLSPERKQQLIDERHVALQSYYKLDQSILEELEGRTVSVDPSEASIVWGYDLDWSPVPVFQNYSAYTTHLDEMNAGVISSVEGPDRILKSNDPRAGVDGRNPNWDPPGQAIATLCNFRPGASSLRWQVLHRVADRCGPETLIDRVEAGFGETVEVPAPAPGEVVFARVDGTGPHGLEKLAGLLYKIPARSATLSDGTTFRLVPATAGDGLLLNSGKGVEAEDSLFSQVPATETIRIDGGSGDLEYSFYRMKVRPARLAAPLDQ